MTSSAPAAADRCIAFGPFRLYAQQRVLLEDGLPLRLGSRAFDILATLATAAGATVTKAELIARVWPDTVVEEANLRVHVAALRKALREGPGRRYIDSVAGRGYSFVAAIAVPAAPRATLPCPPPPAGPLVGRAEAVTALARLVLGHRLVTLVGSGGVGKSAVALTAAARLAWRLPVSYADLADAADAGAVPALLARALGQDDAAGPQPPAESRLLVLDNSERMADAVAPLCERLLQQAPRLHILATGREALRAADERVQRLAPLACPPAGTRGAAILAWPAAALFLHRAGLDGTMLTNADAGAVADICRRLDGLPLALELAAARTDLFHVRELAVRLDDPLRLLKGGRRTAPPRHHSLQASLDWSWATLAPAEQALLRRLTVFAGEFGLAAAARMAAPAAPDEVEDLLATLHARSLLTARATPAGLQCRLVPGMREYAALLSNDSLDADRGWRGDESKAPGVYPHRGQTLMPLS
ncbi:ATP-binding protein [Pseudoduganella chitinolytica]|uniref:Winged helix-turn-helix domain-containing protein n=1 Tax=Pseudoduganella chitinolytica TaxID=34070 RepID=A0ABY8BHQ8_9BURK|nr:winged helix-turn-helix domain-containing protein [Pseudoduganella chitinolytica]WEF33819.1 winged helix-turn-helix domain-containing protein [Pseudoduganella chitinolytica]